MADTSFWKQLDAQNNENAVRIAIASGHYGPDTIGIAQEWVRRKEEARCLAASSSTHFWARHAAYAAYIAAAMAAISIITTIIMSK